MFWLGTLFEYDPVGEKDSHTGYKVQSIPAFNERDSGFHHRRLQEHMFLQQFSSQKVGYLDEKIFPRLGLITESRSLEAFLISIGLKKAGAAKRCKFIPVLRHARKEQ